MVQAKGHDMSMQAQKRGGGIAPAHSQPRHQKGRVVHDS